MNNTINQITITTENSSAVVTVNTVATVKIATAGPQGLKGDTGSPGAAGVGIPAGGTTNQYLIKNSNTDYDSKWANVVISGFNYQQTTPSTIWTINHNLGYFPSVELLDSGSQEIEGTVSHVNVNQVVITLSPATAGIARLI